MYSSYSNYSNYEELSCTDELSCIYEFPLSKNVKKVNDVTKVNAVTKINDVIKVNDVTKENYNESIGFVICRYVTSELHNMYWNECIKQVKLFYPLSPILIIDGGSDMIFVKKFDDVSLDNCTFIDNDYKGRGELSAYYYFYKTHFCERAFIIHDSIFFYNNVKIDRTAHVQFIWDFPSTYGFDDEHDGIELLKKLDRYEELLQLYNSGKWKGCFGAVFVISHSFLVRLEEKYKLFNLLHHISSKRRRTHLERIMALLFINELNEVTSILGNIFEQEFGTSYDYYKQFSLEKKAKLQIVKIWTGR
jgi:hypothetical protein